VASDGESNVPAGNYLRAPWERLLVTIGRRIRWENFRFRRVVKDPNHPLIQKLTAAGQEVKPGEFKIDGGHFTLMVYRKSGTVLFYPKITDGSLKVPTLRALYFFLTGKEINYDQFVSAVRHQEGSG